MSVDRELSAPRGRRGDGRDAPTETTPRGSRDLPVILLVDDVPSNLLALEGMLRREDVDIVCTSSGRAALDVLMARDVAVAIVDVQMPEMDGFELAELMRGVERTRHVPIIFVTAGAQADYRVFTGYQTGAIDFLHKPISEWALRGKVDVLVRLEKQRRELVAALEQARQSEAETEGLLRLARIAGRSEAPSDLYDLALDAVRELLGSDRSAILLVDGGGAMRFQAWRGLSETYRAAVDGHSPWPPGEPDPQPILVADVEESEAMRPYRAVFAAEGIRAIGFIPLVRHRTLLGKFMLYWDRPHAFTAHEEDLGIALASQVAESLSQASMRERERSARAEAEAAGARMAFLAEASRELGRSLDHRATLAKIAELAVPRLADWCAVDLREDPHADPVEVALVHVDPAKVELARDIRRRYPPAPDSPHGVRNVLRTGRSELYEVVSDDLLAASARDAEHLTLLRSLGMSSAMVVPIVAGSRTVGAIVLVASESGRRYGPHDLEMAEELGRRAGIAIENARLFEAERDARREAETAERRRAALQLVSDAALTHLEVDALLREMLARVRRTFRCDTATILLPNAARSWLEVRASDGIEPEAWPDVAVPYGLAIAGGIAARGKPVVVDDLSSVDVHSRVLKARLCSLAGVPLLLGDRILGVLHIGSATPRKFTTEEVELLQMVATRAALAVDRAAAYEDVRKAEERLHVALAAGKMGVWEWDRASGRVTWSPTLEAIHGLAPGTFAGTFDAYQSDIHPEDRARVLASIQETLASGRDHHIEYRIVVPDGNIRWVAAHGRVAVGADGQPGTMIGVCMDVTERKSLERGREAAISELQRTLRDNEVVAGILAHDLRNPLGAILASAEVALRLHERQSETLQEPIKRIFASVSRMSRMIDQLLDFTQARVVGGLPMRVRPTDLAEVSAQAVAEITAAHPEWPIRVESLGDFRGSWDPDRLLQVVSNLVGNAGRHGVAGALITVKIDGTPSDAVSLEVHNAGTIPEERLPDLFAPFGDGRGRSADGLGLGLFITREIVSAHGGAIDFASSEAAGTTFRVRLPRNAWPPQPIPEDPS